MARLEALGKPQGGLHDPDPSMRSGSTFERQGNPDETTFIVRPDDSSPALPAKVATPYSVGAGPAVPVDWRAKRP